MINWLKRLLFRKQKLEDAYDLSWLYELMKNSDCNQAHLERQILSAINRLDQVAVDQRFYDTRIKQLASKMEAEWTAQRERDTKLKRTLDDMMSMLNNLKN